MVTAADGYTNVTTRDTTGCVGGERGNVNTTTITATRGGDGTGAITTCSWELTEWH